MKVGTKLWLTMGVVVGMLLLALIVASGRSTASSNSQDERVQVYVGKVTLSTRWVELAQTNLTRLTASLVSSDTSVDALFKDKIATDIKEIQDIQKNLAGMDLTAETKELMEKIRGHGAALMGAVGKAREAQAGGDQAAGAGCRLDHHHAQREAGDDPVATGEMAGLGDGADGGLGHHRPTRGDPGLEVRVLGRIGHVQPTGDGRDCPPGFQRALVGGGVDPARHARDHDDMAGEVGR